MNLPPDSDASLYDFVLSSATSANFVQTSPATLKSLISSLLGLLIDQKISATLWAKLPQGSAWQTELHHYGSLPETRSTLYLLSSHKDEPTEDTNLVALADPLSSSVISEIVGQKTAPIASPAAIREQSSVYSLQLGADSPLKRDYFLLVKSEPLSAVILAHRSRSISSKPDPSAASPAIESVVDDSGERKQTLQVLVSVDPAILNQTMAGIQQILQIDSLSPSIHSAPINLDELWQRWEADFAQTSAQIDPGLIGQLLASQTQRQEELWQRSTTYRKQAETAETLSLQNQELLNTLRFKDEFLNNVGQELRTPLTNMKTALSLLNSPSLKPPQRQRYMDLISKECDRQSSLITSLLELVRLDQVVDQTTFQPLRLSDVVPGVVSTYQPLAEEKGIRLAYTVPDDLPSISCMSDWLKRIVINLLHNGIKFTPRGGQVWVRAKQQGDYVQLEFRDNGIGIAPSEIPKVFDRFYRVRQPASEDSGGVGLGLTIVQQLLLHCGGSISVKSKLGEGSTFNVLLPIHKSPSDTPHTS